MIEELKHVEDVICLVHLSPVILRTECSSECDGGQRERSRTAIDLEGSLF